jgi:hypothetical protein
MYKIQDETIELDKALFLADIGANRSIYKQESGMKISKKELLADIAEHLKQTEAFLELEELKHKELLETQLELEKKIKNSIIRRYK